MASLRQIRANRLNGALSTGPSEEGKLFSRMNATTHGMAAEVVGFEDDVERAQVRAGLWQPETRAEGPLQLHQLGRMAAASVRIERCETHEADWRYRQSCRGEESRDIDLRLEVAEIAEGLKRRPERVSLRLQQTARGCAWCLIRWRIALEMVRGTDPNGPPRPLAEEQRQMAFDLLGLAPEERLGSRTRLDPPAGTAGDAEVAAHQAGVIAAEIARLEGLQTGGLAGLDAIDREANALGRETTPDPAIRLIRRYEAAAQREMARAQAELLRLQATAAEDARVAAAEELRALTTPPPLAPNEAVATPPPSRRDSGPMARLRSLTELQTGQRPVEPAAPTDFNASFEDALSEAFSDDAPSLAPAVLRGRVGRGKGQPARAAHLGFPR